MKNNILFLGVIIMMFTSCVTVKEYDRVYLNDRDMSLILKKSDRFEANFQAYREAASGANGGKTGGGCGCN